MQAALLVNLGTPNGSLQGPSTPQVRDYLKEFLMDPYVLDIPFLLRWLLVHGLILPRRPAKSAAAYRKIWTSRGSPLLFHHLDLSKKVQEQLGEDWVVKGAMRYGTPNIEEVLHQFKGLSIQELKILPLYPQYSWAATESSLQHCLRLSERILPGVKIKVMRSFYHHPLFIRSFIQVIQESISNYSHDFILFSFHGLPERQIKKVDPSGSFCFSCDNCCELANTDVKANCYRAQCYSTAHALAQGIGLSQDQYAVCFQSRLGRTPWIQPFTDVYLQELPKRGIKRVAVVCPAFVADCLETLEEIQIRGKEDFLRHGGEDLRLVPSLNSSDHWVSAVAQMLERAEFIGIPEQNKLDDGRSNC